MVLGDGAAENGDMFFGSGATMQTSSARRLRFIYSRVLYSSQPVWRRMVGIRDGRRVQACRGPYRPRKSVSLRIAARYGSDTSAQPSQRLPGQTNYTPHDLSQIHGLSGPC